MRKEFVFEGHDCVLICPETPAEHRRWVWRAEFLGGFDMIDQELLKSGWYIAYCCLSDRYGCPSAVADMKAFHDYMVENYGLAPKADIFGFSRGGLYAANYALTYPDDVQTMYLDAPVLDILSWPAGLGNGNGNSGCWEQCKECYGLTAETASLYKDSPRYRADELASCGIPLLMIAGDSDEAVPFDENGQYLVDAYQTQNQPLLLILKENCGHHPHSVTEPEKPAAFIMRQHS